MNEHKQKAIMWSLLAVASVIVWWLAITWAPFGEPMPVWHIANTVATVFFVLFAAIHARAYSRVADFQR